MAKLSQIRKTLGRYVAEPLVRFLASTPVTPNILTWFGFLITIGAAALIATGHLFAAGFVVLAGGLFDILDGALARYTNRITPFGGFLDSVLDRLSDGALLLGILVLFLLSEEQSVIFSLIAKDWSLLILFTALLGSLLVSYIRARAEAAGLECQVGLFTRAERVVILVLGLLLNQIVIALAILAALSLFTVGQRMIHVWQQTRN